MRFCIFFRLSTYQWKEYKQMNKKKEDAILDLDKFLKLLMSEYYRYKNKIFYETFYIVFIIPSFCLPHGKPFLLLLIYFFDYAH